MAPLVMCVSLLPKPATVIFCKSPDEFRIGCIAYMFQCKFAFHYHPSRL